MPIEWVIPVVALVLLVWAGLVYRRLIALREEALAAWSEIDALFQQRQDLVGHLLEEVQGSLGSGSKPIRALVEARRLTGNAKSPDAIGKAEVALGAAIEKVLALAQADARVLRLRSEFRQIENRVEVLRDAFNDAAEDYNAARGGFPAGLLAYVINFPPVERLAVPKGAEPQAERAVQRL